MQTRLYQDLMNADQPVWLMVTITLRTVTPRALLKLSPFLKSYVDL